MATALEDQGYTPTSSTSGRLAASMQGEQLAVGTPGVRPDARGTELRRALLLSVCEAAQAVGATRLVLDACGYSEAECGEDEALGLTVETWTPIYGSVQP